MKRLISIVMLMLVMTSLTVLAQSDPNLSAQEQKQLEAQQNPSITPSQQAQIDKELALKAAVTPSVEPNEGLNAYFIITAQKLNVDIEGLSDDEIMIKVKAAEVQYAIDHPVVFSPEQQAEYDRLSALKEAMAH